MNGLSNIGKNSNPKQVICHLLRKFYDFGWFTGSGGGISIRETDDRIFIAPSGVQKEYVQESDIFIIDINQNIIEGSVNKQLKLSECTPLFMSTFKYRRAGACLHSHSLHCMLVSRIFEKEVQLIDFEMIKGIKGHKNTEWCRVPIIENTENECELTERLQLAIHAYPRSQAVLVRNHGIYVFGENWEKAKIYAECYHYMFNAVLELTKMGIKPKSTLQPEQFRAWICDMEKVDDLSIDQQCDLQTHQVQWIGEKILKKLGVEYYFQVDKQFVDDLIKQKQFVSEGEDKLLISNTSQDFEQQCVKYKTEHIHNDREIRYLLEGSGYFDIRDHKNRFIRIQVQKNDLIILPPGIYHRFSVDKSQHVLMQRYFENLNEWQCHDRPCDNNEVRINYVKKYLETFNEND